MADKSEQMDCETARRLDDERLRALPDTVVSGGLVGARASDRAAGLNMVMKAHAADPHCQKVTKAGYEAGLAAAGDQSKMDAAYEDFHAVVKEDPQNHDAHTRYNAFKEGWSDRRP